MFFQIFFFVCLVIYLISLVEVLGSYWLSSKEFGMASDVNLIFALVIPPLAPMFALAIWATAKELYDNRQKNIHKVEESFFGWIAHGFRTINQWALYKK